MQKNVALADETLQKEIQQTYPDMWQRIATRKAYLKETLKLDLPSEVLLMSNLVGYLRPFYLAKDKALCVENQRLMNRPFLSFFWALFIINIAKEEHQKRGVMVNALS